MKTSNELAPRLSVTTSRSGTPSPDTSAAAVHAMLP